MWAHEDSIETSAPPARVWALFADVNRWNAGIENIQIHGPFVRGTKFTMRPPGQEPLVSTLIEVEPEARLHGRDDRRRDARRGQPSAGPAAIRSHEDRL